MPCARPSTSIEKSADAFGRSAKTRATMYGGQRSQRDHASQVVRIRYATKLSPSSGWHLSKRAGLEVVRTCNIFKFHFVRPPMTHFCVALATYQTCEQLSDIWFQLLTRRCPCGPLPRMQFKRLHFGIVESEGESFSLSLQTRYESVASGALESVLFTTVVWTAY